MGTARCIYEFPSGERLERTYPMFKAPSGITVGKRKARLVGFSSGIVNQRRRVVDPWRKGLVSVAVGVHPTDRRRAMDYAAKVGVPTFYNKDGDPVFESRSHRRKFCEKVVGKIDLAGGYGDYTGSSRTYREPVDAAQYDWSL